MIYYRPIVRTDAPRSDDAVSVAGGLTWFDTCEQIERGKPSQLIAASQIPNDVQSKISAPRTDVLGVRMNVPVIMGVLNVTPDSFSDGGQHNDRLGAIARGMKMASEGADIIDIGGESTRPGADLVDNASELDRTVPVIEGLRLAKLPAPISIDTRKAEVARKAMAAGAVLFNDVTALTYDPDSMAAAAETGATVCLMHASGDPKTMQKNPTYDNVLLDVYDYLSARVDACVAAGIDRSKIIVDPGIGFGKTLAHNLDLLAGLSLFHALGCTVLLGASRKRFIGEITGVTDAADRVHGSVAVGLAAIGQGVQIIRCHDVAEHRQAFDIWTKLNEGTV